MLPKTHKFHTPGCLTLAEVKWSEVTQSCPILCNPTDCSLPGSSIPGILQAGILEWVAISFSRRSSQPRDWNWVSRIAGRHFTIWATREVRMSDSSWVTKQLWLSGSWRSFSYSSSVYSCHLFLISSASVTSLLFVLYLAHPCIKCSLDLSNLLQEISHLFHSTVFFYYFALFIEESILIPPCCSLELCIQLGTSFLFSLAFHFSSFLSYL